MDMNLDNITASIRLLLGKATPTKASVLLLRDYLKESGIGSVFIRADGKTDNALKAAKLLSNDFRVVIECDARGYGALRKAAPVSSNIEILPFFDIADSPSEFLKIVRMLPKRLESLSASDKVPYVLIKNDGKLTDKKRTKAAFDSIIKGIGSKNVKFYWDCGFVLCSFTADELGYFIQKGSEIQFYCPSVMCVDLGLNIHICERLKGLASPSEGLTSPSSRMPLLAAMGKYGMALMPYQSFGMFRKCGGCRYFQKSCSGGCKAAVIEGFR